MRDGGQNEIHMNTKRRRSDDISRITLNLVFSEAASFKYGNVQNSAMQLSVILKKSTSIIFNFFIIEIAASDISFADFAKMRQTIL